MCAYSRQTKYRYVSLNLNIIIHIPLEPEDLAMCTYSRQTMYRYAFINLNIETWIPCTPDNLAICVCILAKQNTGIGPGCLNKLDRYQLDTL